MIKKVVIALLMAVLAFGLYTVYNMVGASGRDDTIEFIHSHINGRGQIDDVQGDIRVSGPDDIQWYDEGDKIEIKYGIMRLKYDREELKTREEVAKLNTILIDVKYYEDDDLFKVYWSGVEIPKYVKY